MRAVLERCLADLDKRIDPEQERANRKAWFDFLDGRCKAPLFTPPARKPAPPQTDWPDVHINDAQEDSDLMLLSQLHSVSNTLAKGNGAAPMVRCNYGTGILPSLFGCEMFVMPRETNTLPAVRPHGSDEAMRKLLAAGPPDIRAGLGGKVFATAERFLETVRRYPKVAEFVELYHPDVQGPIDALEVIWGSEIFLAFYDEPDLVRGMLDLVTDTYARLMRAWYRLVPPRHGEYSPHWGQWHKGRLMIREDSLMNLSSETFVEFIRPCDQRLFDEFGGGAMHFCGRGDHYIQAMSEMPGLTAIAMSQPHLNDMETIFRHTVDKGLVMLSLRRDAAEQALAAGRDLHHRVHCA
ncbi:MAG TPA: hypothetical protein PK082_06800 [Phycisphaerae bacterium]|nr:hypothetical protein [Phycisphaerae bacterium]